MLRNLLLSTALVAAAGSAVAADLPYRTAAPAPYVTAAPIFTWTGFYVGLNAGAAFNNGNGGFSSSGFTAPNPVIYGGGSSNSKTGFTGGVTAGYNMQFGSFVAGVEGDINYLDRNRGNSSAVVPVGGPGGPTPAASYYYFGANQGGSSSNYFGTARARLGFAFDRFLVFGTGGFAFGGNSNGGSVDQYNVTYTPPVTTIDPITLVATTTPGSYSAPTRTRLASTGGNSNSNIGYALGGGMEYAFSNNWSFKAEYLHVSLGNKSRTYVPTTGTPVNSFIYANDKNKFDVVRVGVNYRF
jgi:outer membrane immunogenic protein